MLVCLLNGLSTLQSVIKLHDVAAVVFAISPERTLCLRRHSQAMQLFLLAHPCTQTGRTQIPLHEELLSSEMLAASN